jgi:hypothetical protein
MKINPRAATTLVILLAVAIATPAAHAEAKASYYYSVSLCGYASPGFSSAEYAEFSASVASARTAPAAIALSMRFSLPLNPFSLAGSLAGLSVDLTPFKLLSHPFAWMSPRQTALAPLISFAAMAPVADLKDLWYVATLSPLRLYSGDGYFAAGALELVLSGDFAVRGWGIRLLEFSYFVF